MEDLTHLIYDELGTDKPFFDLVDAFYRGIETDPIIRPMYPEKLDKAKEKGVPVLDGAALDRLLAGTPLSDLTG